MIVFYEIDGVNIACWVNSPNFDAGKRCLVFVHGSGADHRIWIKQYSKLKNDFNIVAFNLPGHGLSEGRGEKDVSHYVKWVKKILDVLALEKPVLIGHSLGAAICLVYAVKYGEELSAIVPVGGGVKMPVNEMILMGLKTDPDFAITLATKFAVFKENRERLSQVLTESLSQVKPDVLYGDFLACNRLDITHHVSRIGIPALIMCGVHDKMTPPALSQSLKENISGAQLSLIDNAGHMVMLENADAFNAVLREFVGSLPSS